MMLLLIVAGTIDYGLAWRAGSAITESTRTGARVGAGMAKNARGDYEVLSGVRASLSSSGYLDDLESVVIYRSSTPDGAPPASCIATSPSSPSGGACIVLNGAQLENLAPSNFSYTLPATPDQSPTGSGCITSNYLLRTTSWCPRDRVNSVVNAQYLGVYVRVRFDKLFPILGDTQTVARHTVMRLEPDPL